MKNQRWIKVVVVVLLATALLVATAFRSNLQRQLALESMLEQVLQRGALRVGMSTFVPWAMKDKKGELVGFEIDVATRLAKDMGVAVEFVPIKWAGIIPALLTGKFDIIIGGMGILPQRNLKVNFSIPYDTTGMSIVAHNDLASGFDSLDDFNQKNVVVAVRLGATPAMAARKYLPEAELRQFDDESQAYQELLNGKAHAVVASAPTPAFYALRYPDRLFLPLKDTFTREPIGFAVRKGDVDSLNFLNNWIRVVQAEGWLKERKHYWFETRDWASRIQ
ncbi:MAG: transporter substrate-binding domain-containing protein [Desulfobacterales bacterium]|nr:transporter substrate-binding domain-containing protein [Desulfobacterales bacterium]